MPEKLFEEAYIRIGKKFKPEILFKKLKENYTKPNHHSDIIKKILNMYWKYLLVNIGIITISSFLDFENKIFLLSNSNKNN